MKDYFFAASEILSQNFLFFVRDKSSEKIFQKAKFYDKFKYLIIIIVSFIKAIGIP